MVDRSCAASESGTPRSYPWVGSTSFTWLGFSLWERKTIRGAQSAIEYQLLSCLPI